MDDLINMDDLLPAVTMGVVFLVLFTYKAVIDYRKGQRKADNEDWDHEVDFDDFDFDDFDWD